MRSFVGLITSSFKQSQEGRFFQESVRNFDWVENSSGMISSMYD